MAITKYNIIRAANGAHNGNKTFGLFHLVTSDAAAVVEADGYLDDFADKFTEGKGDVIFAVMDTDNTPVGKNYAVTRAGGDISLTAFLDATT
jgi:hypothetical protein